MNGIIICGKREMKINVNQLEVKSFRFTLLTMRWKSIVINMWQTCLNITHCWWSEEMIQFELVKHQLNIIHKQHHILLN